MCNAYKEQNKLLNSEILELMKLRRRDKEIIKNKDVYVYNFFLFIGLLCAHFVLFIEFLRQPFHSVDFMDLVLVIHLWLGLKSID